MLYYRIIFVSLVGLVLVKSAEQGPLEIIFKINQIRTLTDDGKHNVTKLSCDHNDHNKLQHIYTAREGEEFRIITKYNSYINDVLCSDYNHNDFKKFQKADGMKNVTAFMVDKSMGTLWNCTVLAHHDSTTILPVVQYGNANYSAAYCLMKLHVRQTNSPQTILVNNMVLQADRTDLSEKNFDYIAEYEYAYGDLVNVSCMNFLESKAWLTIKYEMAGTISDNSIMEKLQSYKVIGLIAKLHSGHDNGHVICNRTDSNDFSIVMVRFVMRTEFNYVGIKINGLTLRPKLKNSQNNYYEIEYKYLPTQPINVVCEVQRKDYLLKVVDTYLFAGNGPSNKKRAVIRPPLDMTSPNLEGFAIIATLGSRIGDRSMVVKCIENALLIPDKKIAMSFHLSSTDVKKLYCSSDTTSNASAEQCVISFTAGNFPIDQNSLNMELPSDGTVMQLYNDKNQLKVIFYEFEDNELLQLKCGPLLLPTPGPVVYLQFKDSDKQCFTNGSFISEPLNVTSLSFNEHGYAETACYMKEQNRETSSSNDDIVLREIRVILSKRVLTTSTSTLIPTTSATQHRTDESSATDYPSVASLEVGDKVPVIAGAVLCIVIICVAGIIVKLRRRNHSQCTCQRRPQECGVLKSNRVPACSDYSGGPHDRNYQNLQTPSEVSIPAHPPQWESNYAVPVDRRPEDVTYSVPCQGPALYSTPTPKHLRNTKQKPVDPTYAVLEVPNARGQKNTFKETDDPNYSEVYANRQEQCYAKVLPKSVRNKAAQDNNPYSYVTNEPAYANTDEPEPMYCEPAKAPGGTYANLNNEHYANSNAQEYVEPTYCEPQKRK